MIRHEKIKPHLVEQYRQQERRLADAAYYAEVIWKSGLFNNNWHGSYFTFPIAFKK